MAFVRVAQLWPLSGWPNCGLCPGDPAVVAQLWPLSGWPNCGLCPGGPTVASVRVAQLRLHCPSDPKTEPAVREDVRQSKAPSPPLPPASSSTLEFRPVPTEASPATTLLTRLLSDRPLKAVSKWLGFLRLVNRPKASADGRTRLLLIKTVVLITLFLQPTIVFSVIRTRFEII